MRLWYFDKTEEISGPHRDLCGDIKAIWGDCTGVWGQVAISGDVSGLKGCLTGLTGSCKGLVGSVSRLHGNISGIAGLLDARLIGDVSELGGDVTGLWGRADGLRGDTQDLADQGLLWPKDQPLDLEMFASRYNLPMEFLEYSSPPALIAFHALESKPEHALMVRPSKKDGFIVGPLAKIQKGFLGQEITEVAVPSQADWSIAEDLQFIQTDKIYVFEHITPMFSSFSI